MLALLLGLGVFLVFDACTAQRTEPERQHHLRSGSQGGWPRWSGQRLARTVRSGLSRAVASASAVIADQVDRGGDCRIRRWCVRPDAYYDPGGAARRVRQCWPEAIELLARAVRRDTLPAVALVIDVDPSP